MGGEAAMRKNGLGAEGDVGPRQPLAFVDKARLAAPVDDREMAEHVVVHPVRARRTPDGIDAASYHHGLRAKMRKGLQQFFGPARRGQRVVVHEGDDRRQTQPRGDIAGIGKTGRRLDDVIEMGDRGIASAKSFRARRIRRIVDHDDAVLAGRKRLAQSAVDRCAEQIIAVIGADAERDALLRSEGPGAHSAACIAASPFDAASLGAMRARKGSTASARKAKPRMRLSAEPDSEGELTLGTTKVITVPP